MGTNPSSNFDFMLESADELLSPRQASEALGPGVMSTSSILNRARSGELPAVRVGNRFKIRRGDLAQLIKPVPAMGEPVSAEDHDALVASIVATFSILSAEHKATLSRLLAPAA